MSGKVAHVGSLVDSDPVFENEFGTITQLAASSLPILSGMSIKRISLAPGAIREPQWNVNANQIAYVVAGTVLVSLLGSGDGFAVLGNTYGLPSDAFAAFDRHHSSQIVRRNGPARIPDSAGLPNARLFDVDAQAAPLSYEYGWARFARKQYWAALEDLSMYSLACHDDGMREPHWHPVTAELGYVHKGHAKMRVLSPDGSLDEYLLEPGQAYFIPRAYPHHIETLGEDGFQFLIFFDQPMPADIGYRATASAFTREVLSAAFGVPERELPAFPFTPMDPLIVGRTNPRDA
jgi:oxalate decarboxylase